MENLNDQSKNDITKCYDENIKEPQKRTGRWVKDEHHRFIKGILKYGNNWKKVKEFVSTRSRAQIRSHEQKYLIKLAKKYSKNKDKIQNNYQDLIKKYYHCGISEENFNKLTKEEIEIMILNIFKNPTSKLFNCKVENKSLKKDSNLSKNKNIIDKGNKITKLNLKQKKAQSLPNKTQFNSNSQKYINQKDKLLKNSSEENNNINNNSNINDRQLSPSKFKSVINQKENKTFILDKFDTSINSKNDQIKLEELKSLSRLITILNNQEICTEHKNDSFEKINSLLAENYKNIDNIDEQTKNSCPPQFKYRTVDDKDKQDTYNIKLQSDNILNHLNQFSLPISTFQYPYPLISYQPSFGNQYNIQQNNLYLNLLQSIYMQNPQNNYMLNFNQKNNFYPEQNFPNQFNPFYLYSTYCQENNKTIP